MTKLSDKQHAVEIVRRDLSRERIELVTREALFHDFLHYSVELALPTQCGFWGTLASGKTFADLNDRSGEAVKDNAEMLYRIEGIVGVMSGIAGMPVEEAFEKLCWLSKTQGQDPAPWCTKGFVGAALERMRQLQGEWKATPFGESMEILWDEPDGD